MPVVRGLRHCSETENKAEPHMLDLRAGKVFKNIFNYTYLEVQETWQNHMCHLSKSHGAFIERATVYFLCSHIADEHERTIP